MTADTMTRVPGPAVVSSSGFRVITTAILLVVAWLLPVWSNRIAFKILLPGGYLRWYIAVYGGACLAIAGLLWLHRAAWLLRAGVAITGLLLFSAAVRTGAGSALMAYAALLVIAGGLGHFVLDALRLCGVRDGENAVFSLSAGLGCLSLLMFPIGLLGGLSSSVLSAILLLLLITTRRHCRNWVRLTYRSFVSACGSDRSDKWLIAFVFACLAVCFIETYLWALTPATRADELGYQLSVPQIYANAGRIINVPETYRSYWAHNSAMLYVLGLTLAGQPLPSLIHSTFGVLTAALLFLFGMRIGRPLVGGIAAVIFYSLPLTTWASGSTYNDLIVIQFGFASFFAGFVWFTTRSERWLLFAGAMAGLAIGTKLSAIYLVLPLGVAILVCAYCRQRRFLPVVRTAAQFGLSAAAVCLHWFAITYCWTRNPVFPYANTLFQSPQWIRQNITWALYGSGGTPGLLGFLLLPFNLVVSPSVYYAGETIVDLFAGLSATSLPLAFSLAPKSIRNLMLICFGIVLLGALLWYPQGPYPRMISPLLPIMALIAALNLDAIWERLSSSRGRHLALVVACGIGLAWFGVHRVVSLVSYYNVPERLPVRYALGLQSREQFLSASLRNYDSLQYLARTAAQREVRVVMIGDGARLYCGKARILDLQSSLPGLAINEAKDSEQLLKILEQHSMEYLLVNHDKYPRQLGSLQPRVASLEFLDRFARLEFVHNNIGVYRIQPAGWPQRRSGSRLLNGDFEELGPDGFPRGWNHTNYPAPEVRGDRITAHSGSVSVRVSPDRPILSVNPIAVRRDATYAFGSFVRTETAAGEAVFQLIWLDENNAFLTTEMIPIPAGTDWAYKEIAISPPERAAYAIPMLRAGSASGSVSVDEADFYELLPDRLYEASFNPGAVIESFEGTSGKPETAALRATTVKAALNRNSAFVSDGASSLEFRVTAEGDSPAYYGAVRLKLPKTPDFCLDLWVAEPKDVKTIHVWEVDRSGGPVYSWSSMNPEQNIRPKQRVMIAFQTGLDTEIGSFAWNRTLKNGQSPASLIILVEPKAGREAVVYIDNIRDRK